MRSSRANDNHQTPATIELKQQGSRRRGKSKGKGRSNSRQSALESRKRKEDEQQQQQQQQQQHEHNHDEQQCKPLDEQTQATSSQEADNQAAPRGSADSATCSSGQQQRLDEQRIDIDAQDVSQQQPERDDEDEYDSDEESQDDSNQDHRQQAKRPLIHKSQQNLLAAGSSIGSTLQKAASMVQMQPAPLQMATSLELAIGQQVADRKLSQCSSRSGHLSNSSSSTSVLDSSRRSSSVYAVDMPANLIKCDNSSRGQQNGNCKNRQQQDTASNRNQSSFGNLLSAPNGGSKSGIDYALSHHRSCDYLGAADSNTSKRMERTISQSMLEYDPSIRENEKFQVYWKNLTFSYEPSWAARLTPGSNKRRLKVLNEISGSIRSNQLIAIIGPSGCGKTTLLQFLAGNNPNQRERIRIRGIDEPKVAFIGQDDSLLPGLTARETLMYASRLQCNTANFDHAAHIQPILSELGLWECSDRNVSKLSGGQAKRVTIAQELLYPTNLLILDEVTSGLDASTSYSIVRLLKYLVSDSSYPMSIVMSIHQPSARLFSVFDKVYVMSEGCCLYEGSCNLDEINEHLRRFQLECPKFHNIADYLIELACSNTQDDASDTVDSATLRVVGDGGRGSEKMNLGPTDTNAVREQMFEFQRKHSAYQIDQEASELLSERAQGQSPLAAANGTRHHQESHHQNDDDDDDEQCEWQVDSGLFEAIDRARSRRERPFLAHLKIHFSRSLLRIRRSYILTWLQLVTYIVLGFQLASFYGPDIGKLSGCPRLPNNLMNYILAPGSADDANEDDELTLEIRRIQENMNFLLVAVLTATFAALEITVITFPLEAKTIKREWCNGWYRVSSYFMGRTLADLPFQVVFVMVFCLLIYSMTGQIGLDTWRFGSFVVCVLMTAFVAQSFGFMFGAIFMNNLPAAVFTAPLAIFPTLLFSGFFARVSQVPYYWRPLTYISHFRYSFDALLVTLYGYDRCNCDQERLTSYHAGVANQTSSMREMFHLLFGASDCLSSASSGQSNGGGESDELTTTTNSLATSTTTTQSTLVEAADSISHEDLAAIHAGNSTLAAQLISVIRNDVSSSTTPTPNSFIRSVTPSSINASQASSGLKQLEDLLVDSVFQQMSASSSASTPDLGAGGSATIGAAFNDTTTAAPATEMSAMDRLAHRFSTRLTGMLNKQSNFGHPMPTECAKFNSYLITEFNLTDDDLLFGLSMLLIGMLLTRLLCNFILHFTIASRVK